MPVELGKDVIDSVTKLRGVATVITVFYTGCVHVCVEPKKLGSDGKPVEPQFLEEHRLTKTPRIVDLEDYPLLGKNVTDSVTGYKGVATARSEHWDGMVRYQVEGKHEPGKELTKHWFDESRINPKAIKSPGGPGRTPTIRQPSR